MTSGDIYIRHDKPSSARRIYFVDPSSPSKRGFTLSTIGAVITESSFTNREIVGKADCEKIQLDQRTFLDAILDVYNQVSS